MIVLLLAITLQSAPSIDDLIRGLSDEHAERREKSHAELRARWKSWTESDLEKLRRASTVGDPESRTRARVAWTFIELLRDVPEEAWRRFPTIDKDLVSDKADPVEEWIMTGVQVLSPRSLIPLLLLVLEDQRDTNVGEADFTYSVAALARETLVEALPMLTEIASPQACRDWWFKNRKRPEEEWHLSGLLDGNEAIRSGALARLAGLKKPELEARLFKTLEGLQSERAFLRALAGLAWNVPDERMVKPLAPYLKDRRPLVRFEVAKRLFDSMPRESVDAVIQSIDRAGRMESNAAYSYSLHEILKWLQESGDPVVVIDTFLRWFTSGPDPVKVEAIARLEGMTDDPRIGEALLQATRSDDPVLGRRYHIGMGPPIPHPRLCDIAAMRLALRLKVADDFEWPVSAAARNRNIEEIRRRWLKAQGMDAPARFQPGPEPLPREKVSAILADAGSDSVERRAEARRQLSILGTAAWEAFQREAAASSPESKPRWREVEEGWCNSLRAVRPLNREGADFAEVLRKSLHRPFAVEGFIDSVVLGWLEDPEFLAMKVEIARGPNGRGIAVSLGVLRGAVSKEADRELSVRGWGLPEVIRSTREALIAEVKTKLGELTAAMIGGSGALGTARVLLQKQNAEGRFLSEETLEMSFVLVE